MDKLKLALDDLVVETFAPAAKQHDTGTVHAHQSGPYTDECQSCGVDTGCGGQGFCDSQYCASAGCGTATCYAYYTCAGAYTCGEIDSCRYPECTAVGAIC
jgi:hypothetical protein